MCTQKFSHTFMNMRIKKKKKKQMKGNVYSEAPERNKNE